MVAARATTPARGGSHEGADRPAAHCGCSDRIARAEAEVAARGVAACWDQERDAETCAVGSGRHCARCSATHAACALCALRPRRAAGEIQWRQRFSIQVMWLLSRLGLDGSPPLRSAGGGLSSDRRAGRLQASARRHACSCRSTARRSSRGIRRHWVPLAAAFDSEAPADPPTRVGYQEIAQALEILRRLLQCCQDRRPFLNGQAHDLGAEQESALKPPSQRPVHDGRKFSNEPIVYRDAVQQHSQPTSLLFGECFGDV